MNQAPETLHLLPAQISLGPKPAFPKPGLVPGKLGEMRWVGVEELKASFFKEGGPVPFRAEKGKSFSMKVSASG